MVLTTVLILILVHLMPVQLWHYTPMGKCNYKYKLKVGQVVAVNNPHWPGMYRAGDTCRWTFDCPLGYFCHLRCYYISIPYSPGCTRDRLLVSTTGDMEFRDAQLYCGRSYIKTKSISSRIVLGLSTNEFSSGGSFKCAVRTEAIVHIDTFINALGIKTDFKTLNRLRGHKLNVIDLYKASSLMPLTELEQSTRYKLAFIKEQLPDTTTEASVLDDIMQAIGLKSTKRNPMGRAIATTKSMKPLDRLIHSLGLNVVRTTTTAKSTTKTTTLPHKRANRTKYHFSNIELMPSISIFDAIIDAIGK